MMKIRALAVINACTLLAHILISYSTQFGLINERTIGEIANTHSSPYSLANMTFGIWGVIYAALAMFCVYHLYTAFRKDADYPPNKDTKDVGIYFILNNVAAIAWLFLWTDNQILNSLVLMVFQLFTLIMINLRLKIHDENRKTTSKAFTQFPFSIYFAWIFVATLANASSYMASSGWLGFGLGFNPGEWSIIFIAFTILLTVLVVITRRNVSFGLVIIWALYGIILKRQEIGADLYSGVMETAWVGTGIVSLTCLAQMIRNFVYENTLNQELPEYSEAEETITVPANSTTESV